MLTDKINRTERKNIYLINPLTFTITNSTIDKIIELNNINEDKNKFLLDIRELFEFNKIIKPLVSSFSSRNIKFDEKSKIEILNIFSNYIDYNKYKYVNRTDLENILLIKLFEQREDFVLFLTKKTNIKHDKDKIIEYVIFTNAEIENLRKLQNIKYDSFLQYELANYVSTQEKIYFVLKYSGNYSECNYRTDVDFPKIINGYDPITYMDLPYNYIDNIPKYAYPRLACLAILPFTDRKYEYGNINVNNFQQFEISSNSNHSAYYYRLATLKYKINSNYAINTILRESILFYLYDDENIDVDELCSFATTFLKSNSINELDKYLLSFSDDNSKEIYKNILFSIYEILRLFDTDKESLIYSIKNVLNKFTNSIIYEFSLPKNIDTIYDKDANGEAIPTHYKLLENGKKEFIFDIDDIDETNVYPTNFIVAKKIENIESIKTFGIQYILDNDMDFPIESGFYNIETPYTIYLAPYESNFRKNGFEGLDGVFRKKYLKRTVVLYIPEYKIENGNIINIDRDEFTLSGNRTISNLPVLAYSYLITPMNEKDRLLFYSKYFS